MGLARLIYVSRATSSLTPEKLVVMIRRASARNAARDISGALVYCNGYFVQMLEGNDSVVVPLFQKIALDPRHRNVQQLSLRPILSRSFEGWGMSFLHEDNTVAIDRVKVAAILNRLQTAPCLEELGGEAASLLDEMKTAISANSAAAGLQKAA